MPSSAGKTPSPQKFPVPWGLFIVLGVYGLMVLGYIWANYWNSPQYRAAGIYREALFILGVDDGRKCSEAELNHAFELTMEAALLMPDEKELVDHLEGLRHRFAERKFELRQDWVNRVEMMSAHTLRIEQSKKAMLVIGSRDRGWAPDQLLQGPQKIALWSLPGAALIIAFWAYTRFSGKSVRDREHEAGLKKAEAEVEDLGRFRARIGPDGRPLPQPGEEEVTDTVATSPPVRAQPPSRSVHGAGARSANDLRVVKKKE